MEKTETKSVFFKNFANYAEATMAKEILEKEGIKSVIQKGDINAASEFVGWIGDVDMFVLENNLDKAKEIVNAYFQQKYGKKKDLAF